MKKILRYSLVFIILLLFTITMWPWNKNKNNTTLKKVVVAEVAHSIFYAPMYVAYTEGYFKEEGLDVEIILTAGADKVTAAVLSDDVNIGFCGSESTIYLYNEGVKDYLVNFAGLTKKDGSFLVSRKKYDNFTVENLKGKTIIGGRKGGMPEMTLKWALKENGIDYEDDVIIDTSIAFNAMSGAFIGGQGDFVSLFEPNALELEKQGLGYVIASIGELGGIVPYTAFNAKKSYIENNQDVIEGFTKAIQKGLDYVHNNSSKDIASKILSEFPDTSLTDLEKIIDRYKNIDSWFKTTYINEDNFIHIEEIMENAKELSKRVPYNKLVNNTYAKKE